MIIFCFICLSLFCSLKITS